MPSILVVVLAAALVAAHLWAPLRWSMALLLGTTFLVPAALAIPGAPSSALLGRVGLLAAAAGLVRRAGRGELDVGTMRPSRTLLALAAFVVVAHQLGVVAAPRPSHASPAFHAWWILADQLLFLWVATVAVRALGIRWMTRTVALLAVAIALIGAAERVIDLSYARWWLDGQLDEAGVAGQLLEQRGDELRVRATAEFALQYGWVLALFLPLVSVLAVRAKRLIALAAPALMVLALLLSISRSPFVGLGAAAVALLLNARGDRRLLAALGAAALVAVFLYLGTSTVRESYSGASQDSVASRERRLELVTAEMAPDPWLGIGLDGLAARGITSTDSAYLLTYAGVGVAGLAVLAAALGTAAVTSAAAARTIDDDLAPVAAAVLGGLLTGVIAGFSFDFFSGAFSAWSFWLLAALAVGLSERAAASAPARAAVASRPSAWRAVLPLGGWLAGAALFALVPTHAALQMRMFVLDPAYLAQSGPNDAFVGRLIIDSTCEVAQDALGPSVRLDCRDPQNLGPGTASVRLQTEDLSQLVAARATFERVVQEVHPHSSVTPLGAPRLGRPTWARTAPLWAALLALAAALLVPPLPPRRRWLSELQRRWHEVEPRAAWGIARGSRDARAPGASSLSPGR